MAVPNLGDLVVTTARKWIDTISDNVTTHNALLYRLKSKGQIKKSSGGRTIDEPLMYGTNSSVQWYVDYDVFTPPTTGQAVIDAAEYQWKQAGGFVSVTGREERMNMGEEQRYDILEARFKQLQAQLNNTIAASMYSDGTGGAGKELTGLKVLVADDPTTAGTVGGIDQVANSFWRNKYASTAAVTSSNVTGFMNSMWLSIIRNKDRPDLIVSDSIQFSAYWASLQAIQRITSDNLGQAGFMSLKYMDADVVYDVNCAAKHQYFLNTDSIHLRTFSDRSAGFEVGDKRTIQNADYTVVPVFFGGNLTCNRRAANGVNISA